MMAIGGDPLKIAMADGATLLALDEAALLVGSVAAGGILDGLVVADIAGCLLAGGCAGNDKCATDKFCIEQFHGLCRHITGEAGAAFASRGVGDIDAGDAAPVGDWGVAELNPGNNEKEKGDEEKGDRFIYSLFWDGPDRVFLNAGRVCRIFHPQTSRSRQVVPAVSLP